MKLPPLPRLFYAPCCRLRMCHSSYQTLRSARRSLSTTPQTAVNANPPGRVPQHSLPAIPQRSGLSRLGSALRVTNTQKDSPAPNVSDYFNLYSDDHYLPRPTPHHLHVYSTKHNTHLTLTRPDRNPIISISTGNLGFRKAGRGTYDAAYQLGAYMMSRIQQQGLLAQIHRLELVMRGFGEGRTAIQKILLGSEGMSLKSKVVKVTDSTRLKFGGTRSKKPRRLG